jgi:hypothetical protein
MWKSSGSSARGRLRLATLVTLLALTWWGTCRAGAGNDTDYTRDLVSQPASAERSGAAISKYKYMFGAPAKWPGVLHWRYNHANAPPAYISNKDHVIEQLVAESTKWISACGIQIVYDGETNSAPRTLIANGPDGLNVIGWGKPEMGISAFTYSFYQTVGPGNLTLVDSDVVMDPDYVTTDAQMTRTMAHEWGHAIGLGHSNVEQTLMSGPPESTYTNYTGLTADDVHGCRCLYGPPAGQQTGDICSLPDEIDFATVNVGATTLQRQVMVTNSGNGALAIGGIAAGGSEFLVGTSGCINATLAPGASCTFGVLARLANLGTRTDQVTIDTSEGPYRIPLFAKGLAALPQFASNFEGIWSNAPPGSESGWGINFAHQGDAIFASWFTYDATGKAWWLSMSANRTGDNVYTGTLYTTRGPPLNAVPFDSNAVSYTPVGAGMLSFSDTSNGRFSYTVNGVSQTKAITPVVFATPPVCTFGAQQNLALATNYQGMWWASGAGEGGWGINFTHQDDIIFASWFTYDLDGSPLWLSATVMPTSPGVFTGTLYRTTGPAFNAVPFNSQNVIRTPVGDLVLAFANGNSATFSYSVTIGTPPVHVTQTKQLSRFVFNAPGTVCE